MNQSLPALQFALGTPLMPRNLAEARELAHDIFDSRLCPPGLDTEAKVYIAILTGAELGISPMRSVQELAIINNRPTVPGGLALSLVRASGLLENFEEWVDGEGDNRVAHCKVRRKGESRDYTSDFSVADAKQAGLWDTRTTLRRKAKYDGWHGGKSVRAGDWIEIPNDAPWYCYQERMLIMRARGFRFRDSFSDVLGGLYLQEEFTGPTIEGEVAPESPQRPPRPPRMSPDAEPPPPPEEPPADVPEAPMPPADEEPPAPPPEADEEPGDRAQIAVEQFAAFMKAYKERAKACMTEEQLDALWNSMVGPHVESGFPHEDCVGLLQSIDDKERGRIQMGEGA